MLASTLALATLAFSGSAIASIGYDKDTGKLASVSSKNVHDLDEEVEYKEVCYRNLYADVDYFKVHNQKELLLSDSKGAQVFLSDGLKKAYDDVEYYYEEYCYKQYKERSHSNDYDASSGILVGKRDFASSLGLGDLSNFSGGGMGLGASSSKSGGGGGGGDAELGGASGLFSKGSFLDTFSKGDGMGDFGLDFGDSSVGDSSSSKKDDGADAKGDQQQHDDDHDGGKGAFDGSSFGSSLLGGGGSFGSGDDKHPVDDGKAYGGDDKDASHKDDGKGDGKVEGGVKKRGFVLFSRRVAVSRH
ncbi:hypothetical protein JCM3775_006684 [Rhodotorula graminis]